MDSTPIPKKTYLMLVVMIGSTQETMLANRKCGYVGKNNGAQRINEITEFGENGRAM